MSLFSSPQPLSFSTNWNNKLNCSCYTTIRLASLKYEVGNEFDVDLEGKPHHKAQVILYEEFFLDHLTDRVAYLDTGYSAKTTADIIRSMYKNKSIDFTRQKLCLVTLKKI